MSKESFILFFRGHSSVLAPLTLVAAMSPDTLPFPSPLLRTSLYHTDNENLKARLFVFT